MTCARVHMRLLSGPVRGICSAIKQYDDALRKEAREHDFKELASDAKQARLKEVQKQKISIHLNLAAAHIKRDAPKSAVEQCSKAMELDAHNVKALFRRGQARLMLGDTEAARGDLLEAARLEPQNKEVRKELEKAKTQSAALRQQQKNLFGGLFTTA